MTDPRNRAKGNVQANVAREAYSVRELAAALGYAMDTIYRAMHQGEIPFFKLRGEYRIPARYLNQKLAEAEEQAQRLLAESTKQVAS